ncbi:Dps family protein [Legionella sp. W05-934-2]|jgi:starvation-inducible DNA-binding protein|uniref:Dps family protein n=1 Tax=Legionella sp. W05-934-2 TaxID=1198649 RepID=UPI003461B929
MSQYLDKMCVVLANTYALYLKTQNYHWHVKGPNFKSLHELFEGQYIELADAVDKIAERILTMGHNAPATFKQFEKLKTIKDGDSNKAANDMVLELANDNTLMSEFLNEVIQIASKHHDEGSVALLGERIAAHEKAMWMLGASKER